MAKVTARVNLSKLSKAIKEFENDAFSRPNMQKIANETTRIIRVRTRLGFGVKAKGERRFPLKNIRWSDRYRELRERRFKTVRGRRFRLSDKTSPGKHNLTFTAQLLDSLRGIVQGRGRFIVKPVGGRRDSPISNEKVAEFVAKQGRKFLNLSNNELKQLEQFIFALFSQGPKNKLTRRLGR